MKKSDPYEALEKSQRFKDWYEDDGLKEAVADMRRAYFRSFESSHISDDHGRRNIHVALKILDNFESSLQTVMGGGQIAKAEIKRLETAELTKNRKFLQK